MVLVGKPVFAVFFIKDLEYSMCVFVCILYVYVLVYLWLWYFCLFQPGALDFLEKPTVAFVRLKEAAVLDAALEPVRFVFALVGPSKTDMDYRETGRAMAALMADKVS